MHDKDAVTDPVPDDGSDRGVPQTKTGTRTVSDLSLEGIGQFINITSGKQKMLRDFLQLLC